MSIPASKGNFLTKEETASKLKISVTTLYCMINNGKITRYKVGNRTLFSENEINDYLSGSRL